MLFNIDAPDQDSNTIVDDYLFACDFLLAQSV